jgi:hypothetical protein
LGSHPPQCSPRLSPCASKDGTEEPATTDSQEDLNSENPSEVLDTFDEGTTPNDTLLSGQSDVAASPTSKPPLDVCERGRQACDEGDDEASRPATPPPDRAQDGPQPPEAQLSLTEQDQPEPATTAT